MVTPQKKPRTIGKTIRDIFNWWVPTERIPCSLVSSNSTDPAQVLLSRSAALISLHGYNSGSAVFLQLHDSATIPSDGAVPLEVHKADENSNFAVERPSPIVFRSGVVISVSSTPSTQTLAGSSTLFVSAQIIE